MGVFSQDNGDSDAHSKGEWDIVTTETGSAEDPLQAGGDGNEEVGEMESGDPPHGDGGGACVGEGWSPADRLAAGAAALRQEAHCDCDAPLLPDDPPGGKDKPLRAIPAHGDESQYADVVAVYEPP